MQKLTTWLQQFLREKRRTVNPLELLVVLVICFGTVGFIKYFKQDGGVWRTVRIQVSGRTWQEDFGEQPQFFVPKWVVEQVNPGDKEYTQSGMEISTIESVRVYENTNGYVTAFVTARIRGHMNQKTRQFIYKSRPVSIGSKITIDTNPAPISGQVIDVTDATQNVQVEAAATLRIRNLDPWMIDALTSTADSQSFELKNQQPSLSIDSFSIQSTIIDTYIDTKQNRQLQPIVQRKDQRDLVVKARLKLDKYHDTWYFADNQPIKIGSTITFATKKAHAVTAEVQALAFP